MGDAVAQTDEDARPMKYFPLVRATLWRKETRMRAR